jgi:hypothetical protein
MASQSSIEYYSLKRWSTLVTEFRTIEIDFDVHKLVENERKSFAETPNDALRRLLGLPNRISAKSSEKVVKATRSWSDEGITLPHGTALKMTYNGRQHEGRIVDGKWYVDGKTFDSPSGAASGVALTKGGKRTRLDGWIYWQVRVPGDASWTPISVLRRKLIGASKFTAEELGL